MPSSVKAALAAVGLLAAAVSTPYVARQLIVITPPPVLPAVHAYWVSPTGVAAWASCKSTTPMNGTAACALSTANNNAVAGDTIYLRGGTYTQTSTSGCGNNYTCGIYPKNRGTLTARITYAAYSNETPMITADPGLTTSRGITIQVGTSTAGTYIRVIGITFKNLYQWAVLSNYASYNEIAHNTFYSETGEDIGAAAGILIYNLCAGGASWLCYSNHNWVHHNNLSKVHQPNASAPCVEGADMIRIGHGYSPAVDDANSLINNDYNTVEDNVISYAGHALMDTYGGFAVIKNNLWNNNAWIEDFSAGTCTFPPMPSGLYGHRGLQTTEDFARPDQWVLVEGNRFGWGSANPGNPGEGNYAITSPSTIVRYNVAYGSHQSGITTKYYQGCAVGDTACALANRGQGGFGPVKLRIYNNTTYYNGYTYPYMHTTQPGCSTCPGKLAGINVYSLAKDVHLKNNMAYGNKSYELYGFDISVNTGQNPASYPTAITAMSNNWVTPDGDPLFVNPNVTIPTSATLPDLTLQAGSGAINGGTSLTTAVGAGSSATTLVVADARYFQDATWGSDLARGKTLFPDWIAIGTVGNTAAISSINYATNTITLASATTWANGAAVWLYKDSSARVVLVGAAPDIGASERP